MAYTKLQQKFCEEPIDWLKALMLYRINEREGYSMKELAADSGIGYANLRRLMAMVDTMDWGREQRKSVCRALHISEEMLKATAHF